MCKDEPPREPDEPGSETMARVDLDLSSSPPAQSSGEADEWGAQHHRDQGAEPYAEAESSDNKAESCNAEAEGSEIHFRNIRILELPGGNATPEQTAPVVK